MGPKRKHPDEEASCVCAPTFKKERSCEPQNGSVKAKPDSKEWLDFNTPIGFDIVYVKDEFDHLTGGMQAIQSENTQQDNDASSEHSFLTDPLKIEVKVEDETEVEDRKNSPSTFDNSTGLTSRELISQTPDAEIKEELKPLVKDECLCETQQEKQMETPQQTALTLNENAFTVKTEVTVEEGEMEFEDLNVFPSTTDDMAGMQIEELIAQTTDDYFKIEEESKPLVRDNLTCTFETKEDAPTSSNPLNSDDKSFLTDILKIELNAEEETEMEDKNIFPSTTSDDKAGMTIEEIIAQSPDGCAVIREESKPSVKDECLRETQQEKQIGIPQQTALTSDENEFLTDTLIIEVKLEKDEMEFEDQHIFPSTTDDVAGVEIEELIPQTSDDYFEVEEEPKPLVKDNLSRTFETMGDTSTPSHVVPSYENSSSTDTLKVESKVEDEKRGMQNIEDVGDANVFPSTSDDTGGMTIEELIAQTPDEYIEITKESATPMTKDDCSRVTKQEKPATSKRRVNYRFVKIGGIPILMKTEPDDCSETDEPAEMEAEHGSIAEEGEKDIPSGSVDDSCVNEIGPAKCSDGAGEGNDPVIPEDTSGMILDPETGLFRPPDDAIDGNDESSENAEVPETSDILDRQESAPSHQPEPIQSDKKTPLDIKTSLKTLSVSVSMLLDHPLTSGFWTEQQQNDIVVQAIPLSKSYRVTVYNSEQSFLRDFSFSEYPWLCEEMDTLYCWPCILFTSSESRYWCVTNFINIHKNIIEETLHEHQTTSEHQNAQTTYKLKRGLMSALKRHSEVITCKKLWERLVRTICLEKKEKNTIEFNKNPEFAAEVQDIIKTIFKKNMSPVHVFQLSTKILTIVTHQLRGQMIDEVRNAVYVTLHLEDLSGTVGWSWLAMIARYANRNGTIRERVIDFIRTYPAKAPRTAVTAIKWIQHIFSDYKLTDNVVGFSYSASVVVPSEVPTFHGYILNFCPRAMFYPSPFDDLHKAMFQALSNVSTWQTRRFFLEAQEMCEFVTKNDLIDPDHIPVGSVLTDRRSETFIAYFPAYIGKCYSTLLAIFQGMVALNLTKCGSSARREANKFYRFLQNPQNRLLMVIVGKIFSIVAGLAGAIRSLDMILAKEELAKSIYILNEMKSLGLPEILGIFNGRSDPVLAHHIRTGNYQKSSHIVREVITEAVAFLTHRFENLYLLKYTSSELLKFPVKHTRYPILSHDFIRRAKLDHEDVFQLEHLMTSDTPAILEHSHHTELLERLVGQNLTDIHTGLHKYLLYVHTISFAKSEQRQLLDSVYSFVQNRLRSDTLRDATLDFLYGFFWQKEEDLREKMLADPELYFRVLQVCHFKVIVENDFNAYIVDDPDA